MVVSDDLCLQNLDLLPIHLDLLLLVLDLVVVGRPHVGLNLPVPPFHNLNLHLGLCGLLFLVLLEKKSQCQVFQLCLEIYLVGQGLFLLLRPGF